MKILVKFLVLLLPWAARRWVLTNFFGFQIDPSAKIGLSWIFPKHLIMGPGSRIGHLTVAINIDEVRLDEKSSIGRLNWITGFPGGGKRLEHQPERRPRLHVQRHAAVTNRHIIDCTNEVTIGEFATVAGFRSQILTHSIDLFSNRQSSSPIMIGARSFVGTSCVVLGGAVLPECSVLGAGSLLNKAQEKSHMLYAGVPAKAVKELSPDLLYFGRIEGFVV